MSADRSGVRPQRNARAPPWRAASNLYDGSNVSVHSRKTPLRPLLVLAAALLLLPALASADQNEAEPPSRASERVSRQGKRAEQSQARRAARLEAKAAREAERDHRRVARVEANAERTSAKALKGCRLSISTDSKRITAGDAVSISGELVCPPGTSAGGQQVTVSERPTGAGRSAFAVAATATTEPDGSYLLPASSPQQNAIFKARVGTSAHGAQTAVKVAPLVTLDAPQSTATSSALVTGTPRVPRVKTTFTGTVTPADPGAQVALQVDYPGSADQWRTVALGRVGAGGTYAIKHGFRIAAAMHVRTIAHTGKAHVPAASNIISFQAPQAQNPKLTIHAAADPISAGEPITISGVAGAGAGQSVKLLARTTSGSFATVTTATTGPEGNYSFTQAPTQNTSYLVSDASEKSAVAFEGVRRAITVGTAPSALDSGAPLTLTGSVSPAVADEQVYLETQTPFGFSFHVIASATVASDGSYTISASFVVAREYTLRVKTPADAHNQASTSASMQVAVGPPASPLAH